jgi:hypothetical protein
VTRSELEEAVIEMTRAPLAPVGAKIAPAFAAATSQEECEKIIRAALLDALAGLENAAPGRRN